MYASRVKQLQAIVGAALLAAAAAAGSAVGLAQTPAPPTFDAAVIRPAPSLQQQVSSGQLRVGTTITDARIDLRAATLGDMVVLAYRLKPYQLIGPDWIRQERYDVQATYPPGATKEQMPEMLQALLADRFTLKVRRETRPLGAYELIVEKTGHALQPATPAPAEPAPLAPNEKALNVGGQELRIGANGKSAAVSTPDGAMRIAMGDGGMMRLQIDRMTMSGFADLLTTFAGKPVVDRTGLTDRYQIPLEIRQEDVLAMARAQAQTLGIGLPPGAPGGGGAGAAADPGGASSVISAVRKLGLRLESRDVPFDIVVVESAERVPSEN